MMSKRNRDFVLSNGERIIYIPGIDSNNHPLLKNKLIDREELKDLGLFLEKHRVSKAFTTGVFDMTHFGHARYLELARSLAGRLGVLMVGLNSDNSVHKLKGPDRPIVSEMQRAEMLAFLECVTYITIFDEVNGAATIKQFRPNAYLCVEGSWEGDLEAKSEVKAMKRIGKVYYTPRQGPTISTTAIIEKIQRQNSKQLLSEFRNILKNKNGFEA